MNSTEVLEKKARSRLPARAVAWPSMAVTRWMRQRIVVGGGNPDDVPDVFPTRFLRRPEVCQLTGLSTSSLYRMIGAEEFPRPVAIDRASSVRSTA